MGMLECYKQGQAINATSNGQAIYESNAPIAMASKESLFTHGTRFKDQHIVTRREKKNHS